MIQMRSHDDYLKLVNVTQTNFLDLYEKKVHSFWTISNKIGHCVSSQSAQQLTLDERTGSLIRSHTGFEFQVLGIAYKIAFYSFFISSYKIINKATKDSDFQHNF